MITSETPIKEVIKCFCAQIGIDPLLVQGAGGNISWKEGEILWVKASGKWLAHAKQEEIFVGVDFLHIKSEIKRHNFSSQPKIIDKSNLKPSIETFLHALIPHRIVLHLHSVEILSYLVRQDCGPQFENHLTSINKWRLVDYHKPGPELAAVVSSILAETPETDVLFLANHGVVIGADTVTDVASILSGIISALQTGQDQSPMLKESETTPRRSPLDSYVPVRDLELHQLALNPILYNQVRRNWALYPDHVVFLGANANCYSSWKSLINDLALKDEIPEIVFIKREGVFAIPSLSAAKQLQLRCFYDVISRLSLNAPIRRLTNSEVNELMDWDAERYRVQHNS